MKGFNRAYLGSRHILMPRACAPIDSPPALSLPERVRGRERSAWACPARSVSAGL